MADDFGDFTGFNSGPTNGSAMAQTQQSKLPPLQVNKHTDNRSLPFKQSYKLVLLFMYNMQSNHSV